MSQSEDLRTSSEATEESGWALSASHMFLLIIGGIGVLGVFMFAAVSNSLPGNTDPRQGWVTVLDPNGSKTDIQKICEGTTLIYKGEKSSGREESISTVANSPECRS